MMSVDVQAEVIIDCPREVVGEFLLNPRCDRLWMSSLSKVFPVTPDKFTSGSKDFGSFLTRCFSRESTRTGDKASEFLEFAGDRVFIIRILYRLYDQENGTKVSIRVESGDGRNRPLPAGDVRQSLASDLNRLKTYLEERDPFRAEAA